jgi:mannosyltransferase
MVKTVLKIKQLLNSHYELIILPILIMIGSYISFYFLGKESLRLDESQSIWQVNRPFWDIFPVVASDVHLPLYNIILFWWRSLVGVDIFNNRQISLIFFLFGIVAIYFLTKLISENKNIAVFTSVLFTISPYMNWYANELRMYSLLVLVTIVSHYFFLRIYFDRGRSWLNWLLYLLISIIGIYTHYFYFLVLLSQLIFYALFWVNFPKYTFRYFISVLSLIIIAFAPWVNLVLSLGRAKNQSPLLVKPSSIDYFNIYSQHVFGFQGDYVNSLILSFWPILGLLALLLLKKNNILKPKLVYLGLATFVPIFISFIVSYSLRPIFLSRYLSICVPSMFIMISYILFSYNTFLGRFMKVLIPSLMSLAMVMQITSFLTPVRENYREAISYIVSSTQKDDIVAISAPFTVFTFDYYYNGTNQLVTIPSWDRNTIIPPFDKQSMVTQVNSYSAKYNRIYLLLSYDQGYEKDVRQYFDDNFLKLESFTFSPKLNLIVYDMKKQPSS